MSDRIEAETLQKMAFLAQRVSGDETLAGPQGGFKSSATTIREPFAAFGGPRTKLVKAGGSSRLGQNRP